MTQWRKGQSGNPATMFKRGYVPSTKKLIPADKLPLITKMASEAKSERRIALALKMDPSTWQLRKREYPEVADALALGQELLRERIIGYLLALAKKGNVIASIYLSKSLCGMRDNDEPGE